VEKRRGKSKLNAKAKPSPRRGLKNSIYQTPLDSFKTIQK